MELTNLKSLPKLPANVLVRGLYWLLMIVAGLLFACMAFGLVSVAVPIMCNKSGNDVDLTRSLIMAGVSLGIGAVGALVALLAWGVARSLFRTGDWLYLFVSGYGRPDGLRNPVVLAAKQLVRHPWRDSPPELAFVVALAHEMLGRMGGKDAAGHLEQANEAIEYYRGLTGPQDGIDDFVARNLLGMGRNAQAAELYADLLARERTGERCVGLAEALEADDRLAEAEQAWRSVSNESTADEAMKTLAANRARRTVLRQKWEREPPTTEDVAAMDAETLPQLIKALPGQAMSLLADLPEKKPQTAQALKSLTPEELKAVLAEFPDAADKRRQIVHRVVSGAPRGLTIALIIVTATGSALVALFGRVIPTMSAQDFPIILLVLGGMMVLASLYLLGFAYGARKKYNQIFSADHPAGWRGPLKLTMLLHPLAVLGALAVVFAGYQEYRQAHPPGTFDRWGLTFKHPVEFEEMPREKLAAMRTAIDTQLAQELAKPTCVAGSRRIQDFTVLTDPGEQVAVVATLLVFDVAPEAERFKEERELVVRQEMQRGDVTRNNTIELTRVGSWPALIEDDERSNRGRGVCLHILAGKKLYQVAFVVNDREHFKDWADRMKQLHDSITVRP